MMQNNVLLPSFCQIPRHSRGIIWFVLTPSGETFYCSSTPLSDGSRKSLCHFVTDVCPYVVLLTTTTTLTSHLWHNKVKLEHFLDDELNLTLFMFHFSDLHRKMSSRENITIHILFYLHVTW